MKRLVVVAGLGVLGLSSNEVDADERRDRWLFRVTDGAGRVSVSHTPTSSDRVQIPGYSAWQCEREPVATRAGRVLVGGFVCRSESGFVSVMAACITGEESWDKASAIVGTADAYVRLEVVCATSLASTPRLAPIEANL